MKKYRIRIILHSGTSQTWHELEIEVKEFYVNSGYYYFKTTEDKVRYYPINNTIIEEL